MPAIGLNIKARETIAALSLHNSRILINASKPAYIGTRVASWRRGIAARAPITPEFSRAAGPQRQDGDSCMDDPRTTLFGAAPAMLTLSQSPTQAVVPIRRADQAREIISRPVVAAFCAGGIAGAVSRTVVSPLERLKILFQVQSAGRDAYKLSVGQGLAKMWREEGWRGLMRGNGTNCIRIVPYSAVQFGSYNFYRRVRGM